MATATKSTTSKSTVNVPASEAKAAPKAKAKPVPSAAVASIRSAVETLQSIKGISSLLEFKTFNGGNSFVCKLPTFKDAVMSLPKSDEAKSALTLLKNTRAAVESFTGNARQTWVFHTSGSFALYSKLQG